MGQLQRARGFLENMLTCGYISVKMTESNKPEMLDNDISIHSALYTSGLLLVSSHVLQCLLSLFLVIEE